MKSQKEAERAEQQRIKNLVLNLNESQENGDTDGTDDAFVLQPNPNLKNGLSLRVNTYRDNQGLNGDKPLHNAPIQQTPHHPTSKSADKPSGHGRGGGHHGSHASRSRKLQLSDVDWYDRLNNLSMSDTTPASLRAPSGRGRGYGGRFRRTRD